ncbi:FkbM family methyltransferase [Enterovirga aerilata]|uniref:FkbM family methyltransferase n=1 Tax=Enterovirga aerilata TaxID=2730920 RepID=A0A849IKQ8_9HYPH|nr:FkbM family methyltransferase [Enterovirga sp. DB1703]NNM74533.1 FkbM family methyltransferase [Enterovirga sp. DB1703]
MTDLGLPAGLEGSTDLRGILESSCPPPLREPPRGRWIYGAGGFGRQLARELVRLNLPVLGFIDRKGRESADVDGMLCRHPDDLPDGDARGTHLVYGILNHAVAPHEILSWAESRPFDQLVFPTSFYEIEGFALDSYWLGPPRETLAHLSDLMTFYDRLADEESRTTFLQLLQYRLSSDPRRHPAVREKEVYVERFLPIFDEPIIFVDAGAFTGDSLEALLDAGVKIAEWLAFEPDPENLRGLRRTAKRRADALARYTLVPAGLADTNGRLLFASSGSMSSRLAGPDDTGNTLQVEVLRFDDAFRRSGRIYVKMDIEGAEREALRGMRNLLAQQRPILAISAYHRTADLWEIPKLVCDLYPQPRLRLRQHGHHGFESVLYVSPG